MSDSARFCGRFFTLVNFTAMIFCSVVPNAMVNAQEEHPLRPMVDGEIDDREFEVVDVFDPMPGSDIMWQKTISRVGTNYLRVHFTDFQNPESESFRLVIKDQRANVVAEYDSASLLASDFWTPVILGQSALIQLRAASTPQGLKFVLKEIAYQKTGGVWESIIDDDEREHIVSYQHDPDIKLVSRSVAKLSFFKDDFYVCSGFMISTDQLMTNHHCVATDDVCETTMVLFGYQFDSSGDLSPGKQYACKKVVSQDYELDYAILEVHGSPGEEWGFLSFSAKPLSDDEDIYIVQHPAGEPKQISKINCRVDGAIVNGRGANTDLAHVCDTMGGSSGSPVFTLGNTVVGLHHFGVGQAQFWDKNRAVRIQRILDQMGD